MDEKVEMNQKMVQLIIANPGETEIKEDVFRL
jgi:hypothetical protein